MQALALGVPIVSLKKVGGNIENNQKVSLASRFAEALYSMMNYTELLVPTIPDYIQLSLQLTHNTKLRSQHVDELVKRRETLFKDSMQIGDQWHEFLEGAIGGVL